jgi:hypothetical protein
MPRPLHRIDRPLQLGNDRDVKLHTGLLLHDV